jgi:hypothetical protein
MTTMPHEQPQALSLADADELDGLEDIAREFLHDILGLDASTCFISNDSQLSDFELLYRDAHLDISRKVFETYGVRIQPDFLLADIFQLIRRTRNAMLH